RGASGPGGCPWTEDGKASVSWASIVGLIHYPEWLSVPGHWGRGQGWSREQRRYQPEDLYSTGHDAGVLSAHRGQHTAGFDHIDSVPAEDHGPERDGEGRGAQDHCFSSWVRS